jgi:hypothetical protein
VLEHISEADAPPLLASQVFNAEVFPDPSHSTVGPAADVVMEGTIVSLTVTVVSQEFDVCPSSTVRERSQEVGQDGSALSEYVGESAVELLKLAPVQPEDDHEWVSVSPSVSIEALDNETEG